MDTWTKIDVVVQDQAAKKMYWGSCKRTFTNQSVENYIAHLYSFTMARTSDPWWRDYEHVLFFISPTVDENHMQKNIVGHFPAVLKNVREKNFSWLTENAKRQLTKGKRNGTGEWEPPATQPDFLFSLADYFYVFSLQDLLTGNHRCKFTTGG